MSCTQADPVAALRRAQAVTSTGDGFFYVTGALALSSAGHSATQVGLMLTVAWAAAMLTTPGVGRLADRVGPGRLTACLPVLVAAALLAVAATVGGALVAVALVAYAVGQAGLLAVRQGLLVVVVPAGRMTRERARLAAVGNAGNAVGALLAAVALVADTALVYRCTLVADAALFLAGAYLLRPLRPLRRLGGRRPPRVRAPGPDARYLAATALTAVVHLYMPMLSVALPLLVATRTDLPAWVVSAVLGANMTGVLALQSRAAARVNGLAGAAGSLRRAGPLLAASCLAFALATGGAGVTAALPLLAVGVGLQVLGEVTFAAGSWEVGFGLADPEHPGTWQGVHGMAVPAARAIGPAFLTWLLVGHPAPGWLALAAVFLTAALLLGRLAATASTRVPAARAAVPDTDADEPVGAPGGP